MRSFEKAVGYTVGIGYAVFGVYIGLLILRVAFEVAGLLVGSLLGTIVFLLMVRAIYKKLKK